MEILENNKRALKHVMPKFLEQRLAAAGVKNVFLEMAADGERIFGIERENRKWYLNSRYDTAFAAAVSDSHIWNLFCIWIFRRKTCERIFKKM